jgi:type II secretory pathway component GspD/PulD (secretin)
MKIFATILVTSLLLISAVALAINSTNYENLEIDSSVKITENIHYDSPIKDLKKLMKLLKKYNDITAKIAEDKIITDEEAIEYKKIDKKMNDFDEEVMSKYENSEKTNAKMEKWQDEHSKEFEDILDKAITNITALYECEGADKIGFTY